METIKPSRSTTRLDDDLDNVSKILPSKGSSSSSYERTIHYELHARACRGLQALGFCDVHQTIAKHGVPRVVLGLNWVASNPYPRNKGGLLRKVLESGEPIPQPLPRRVQH